MKKNKFYITHTFNAERSQQENYRDDLDFESQLCAAWYHYSLKNNIYRAKVQNEIERNMTESKYIKYRSNWFIMLHYLNPKEMGFGINKIKLNALLKYFASFNLNIKRDKSPPKILLEKLTGRNLQKV